MHRIALALALALAACGGPKKQPQDPPVPAAPPDAAPAAEEKEIPPELTAKVEKALALVQSIAETAEGAAGDCKKMATGLQALADGPDGKVIMELDVDPSYPEHAEQIGDKYGQQLGAIADRIANAISACNTPEVNAALTGLGLGE